MINQISYLNDEAINNQAINNPVEIVFFIN